MNAAPGQPPLVLKDCIEYQVIGVKAVCAINGLLPCIDGLTRRLSP